MTRVPSKISFYAEEQCPICEEANIYHSDTTMYGDETICIEFYCSDCDAMWNEYYVFERSEFTIEEEEE